MKIIFSKPIILFTCATVFLYSCETLNYTYSTENPKTLEVELVQDMTIRYQSGENLTEQGDPNTTSIWFDLTTLKEFLYQVEKISTDTDSRINEKRLGVRVYLTTYPDKRTWTENQFEDLVVLNVDEHTEQYEYKNTVILIPTLNQNGVNLDFDPLGPETYREGIVVANTGKDPLPIIRPANNATGDSAAKTDKPVSSDERTMGLNHGTLIPPPIMEQQTSFGN